MNDINNKELLLKSIDDYPLLTTSQKDLLKILISFDTGVNAKTIIEVIKLKKQSVYPNLKYLLKNEVILKDHKRNAVYSINKHKMYEIIEFYNKKQTILQNSSN